MNIYPLAKALWTDADFDEMNWHDNPIHAIAFDRGNDMLLIDIDYIFEWKLSKNKRSYKFWIAPCTLVFDFVKNFSFEGASCDVIITAISKKMSREIGGPLNLTEYTWEIETVNGGLTFNSTGYQQYVRQSPIFIHQQFIHLELRGGISFSTDIIKT